MAKGELPSRDLLRQLLTYEPDTGLLFWKERGPQWFNADARLSAVKKCNAWNARNAGRQAFTASDHKGYLQGQVAGYHTMAHRVIWAWLHDEWPDCLDHIDGDGCNNREVNLRRVTRAENSKNRAVSKHGVMGVRFHKGGWDAMIGVGGKQIHLGRFTTKEAAIAVRKEAETQHGFHCNHGRLVRTRERNGVAKDLAA